MKFFATIARAFVESRQRQADRIIRDHSFFAHRDLRMAAENMNVVKPLETRAAAATSATEFKLAA